MKSSITGSALALALVVSTAAASAAPTAVENSAVVVQGGLHFQKQIVLNQAALCDGSVRLEKGTYDVKFESLPGNRARATFFQGGARKGEAQGIIVVNSKGQGGPAGGQATRLGNVAFGPEYGFQQGAGKMDLVVGNQGQNQILIGLLLPAVQKGGLQPPGIKPAAH